MCTRTNFLGKKGTVGEYCIYSISKSEKYGNTVPDYLFNTAIIAEKRLNESKVSAGNARLDRVNVIPRVPAKMLMRDRAIGLFVEWGLFFCIMNP